MTVALLQAGAAQNTGVSSPSSQSSVNYAPWEGRPTVLLTFQLPAAEALFQARVAEGPGVLPSSPWPSLQLVRQTKKTGSQLPCLCLLAGWAVSMSEEASPEVRKANCLIPYPTCKEGISLPEKWVAVLHSSGAVMRKF